MRAWEYHEGQRIPGTRYAVVRPLGMGGMGSVYEVEHLELGKRFVLKALLRELAAREDLVARMKNEQRALGRLEHPNIVAITDAGTTADGVPYFVMERLTGETLSRRLKHGAPIGPQEALHIALGIVRGLAAAHDIGIVHRDVKPANVFLCDSGLVKLLDFGIAKAHLGPSEVITARGLAIGTPRFMSPEQARGDRVDGRADLYATGLILYQLLAGRGPFDDARDANELLLAHIGREAPRLATALPGISASLDALVASLLQKDPRARPSSAHAVAAELARLLPRYQAPADDPTPTAGYESTTALLPVESAADRTATAQPAWLLEASSDALTCPMSAPGLPATPARWHTLVETHAAQVVTAPLVACDAGRTHRLPANFSPGPGGTQRLGPAPWEVPTHTALPALVLAPGDTPAPVVAVASPAAARPPRLRRAALAGRVGIALGGVFLLGLCAWLLAPLLRTVPRGSVPAGEGRAAMVPSASPAHPGAAARGAAEALREAGSAEVPAGGRPPSIRAPSVGPATSAGVGPAAGASPAPSAGSRSAPAVLPPRGPRRAPRVASPPPGLPASGL